MLSLTVPSPAESAFFGLLHEVKSGLLATKAPNVPDWDPHYVLASFVLHSLLFIFLPASPWLPKKGEIPASHRPGKPYSRRDASIQIRNGLVSTIHAALVVACVVAWLLRYGQGLGLWEVQRIMQGGVATPGNSNGDAWFPHLVSVTFGYFIYDTICMLVYRKQLGNVGSYIHHFAIGIALFFGLFTGIGRTYHFVYLFDELSTIPLNLKNLYRDSPGAYKFWSVAFVLSFVFARGLLGIVAVGYPTYYCLITFWLNNRSAQNWYFTFQIMLQGLSFTCSRLLNIYWMSLIAKYVRKSGQASPATIKKLQ